MAFEKLHAENASAVAFLKEPISVRQVGMGNLSLGEDDILRVASNPALLARQPSRGTVAIGGASFFDGEDTTLGLAAGWRISPQFVAGCLISSFGSSFPEIDDFGYAVGSTLDRSVFVGGAMMAFQPQEYLQLGGAVKYISDKIVDESKSVLALDAGAALFVQSFAAGVSIRNVGPEMYSVESEESESLALPTEIRFGASYSYRPKMITAGVEYASFSGAEGQIMAGIEWWPVEILALRVGMTDISNEKRRISLGISAMHQSMGLDYSFSSHPLGATHRAGLSYRFGQEAEYEDEADSTPEAAVRMETEVGDGSKVSLESEPESTVGTDSSAGAILPQVDVVDVNKEYKDAVAHYEAGDIDSSLKKIGRIIEVDPNHWQAWWLLGNCHYQAQDIDGAVIAYKRSLALNPDNPGLKSWLETLSR